MCVAVWHFTYVAKVEEVLGQGEIVLEVGLHLSVGLPVSDGVEEQGFDSVQTKVVIAGGHGLNRFNVGVASNVLSVHEVHGSRTGHAVSTRVSASADTGFQLVDGDVGTIGFVGETQKMVPVGVVGLVKVVGASDSEQQCWVHAFASFELVVACSCVASGETREMQQQEGLREESCSG